MPRGRGNYIILSGKKKKELFEHYLLTGEGMKYYAEKYNITIQRASQIISEMFEKRKSHKK